jgi:hypothetical protein
MKSVSVPESAAGGDTTCPECGTAFPVPARYTPVVSPQPTLPPPPPAAPTLPPPPVPVMELPSGYAHSRGFALSPSVVAWIPAVALLFIFFLTSTPWVGVFPNGHPVYTQGPWRAITGYPSRSIQLEKFLLKELPPPSVYDRTSSDWLLMLPYMLVLIAAVLLAWAERLEASQIPTRLARRIPGLWPYRHLLLAVLATLALVLLAAQAARGFGLERAMHAAVADKFEPQRKAAASPGDQQEVNFSEEQELARYNLERTGWFWLAVLLHILVVAAMLLQVALARRGNRPPPRIVLQY